VFIPKGAEIESGRILVALSKHIPGGHQQHFDKGRESIRLFNTVPTTKTKKIEEIRIEPAFDTTRQSACTPQTENAIPMLVVDRKEGRGFA
jgi:hypothetical protein